MITAKRFCDQARTGNYIGIPYTKLDCQGFVEKVLSDCGIKKDWRGSNHMWRDALNGKYRISNYDVIPAGSWLFVVADDGGEKARGYNDKEGNAKHVGIYLGDNCAIHSTTGGVQFDMELKRWTHYGLCKYINYNEETQPTIEDCLRLLGDKTLAEIYDAFKKVWG